VVSLLATLGLYTLSPLKTVCMCTYPSAKEAAIKLPSGEKRIENTFIIESFRVYLCYRAAFTAIWCGFSYPASTAFGSE